MTRVVLLLLLLLGLPGQLGAQEISPWIKYGKWGLLVVTVGFNLASSEANERANQSFDDLTNRCLSDPQLCTVDDSGVYHDPISEELFQRTSRLDTSSRRFLIAGQAALLGAAAMFIYEFTRPPGVPDDNIPFAPLVQDMGDAVGVGIEINF
ncbi:MAG: hypothetical protein O7E49_01550 [Gemmatimonadetes bacterium]|nr:hypothetical protein [Gemmatimonadota bacterium]